MTFLNPLVLFGLITATIPIILHLLNLRKLRKIDFSTLTFLKELQQTKIRRLKLKQLLLLLIRTLLIIFIVLAFARPALKGTFLGKISGKTNSSVILILDDSFSMSASDEFGDYLKQAKEACSKVLDLLKEGDEVTFIKLSEASQFSFDPPTHDFNIIRKRLSETQVSQIRQPIIDAIPLTSKILKNSKNANKEVYIFTDMQRTLFEYPLQPAKNDTIDAFDARVQFFYTSIGNKETPNISIDSIKVLTSIFELNKPVNIFASFRNFSSTRINNLLTSIYINGVRSAQRNISIESWSSASTTFTFIPKQTGFLKGYIEIENDAIEFDNRRYFTIYMPENIDIALTSKSEEDIKFLKTAIQASSTNTISSLLTVNYIPDNKFSFHNLKNNEVLILTNISSITKYDAERIAEFIKFGGGVIIFPGNAMNIKDINEKLLSILNVSPIVQISDQQNTPLTFKKIDFEHPIFNTIFEPSKTSGALSINSPLIYKIVIQQPDKHAQTIIKTNGGEPFLNEYPFGQGKILFFYTALDLSWSDFPLKGIFAPIIYRSILYVTSRLDNQQSYLTGAQPTIKIRKLSKDYSQDNNYRVISPIGIEEIIQPVSQTKEEQGINPTITFKTSRLENQGIYEIQSSDKPVLLLPVNLDPLESDTRKANEKEIKKFLEQFRINSDAIHSLDNKDKIQSTILQTRFGIELWKYFIIMVLILALIEMLIARDSKKKSTDIGL